MNTQITQEKKHIRLSAKCAFSSRSEPGYQHSPGNRSKATAKDIPKPISERT